MRKYLAALLLAICICEQDIYAADDATVNTVREWRERHEQGIVDEFVELLRLPNVASDPDGIQLNAEHAASLLRGAGMQARVLRLEGANPVVFAERSQSGAKHTIMIYIHYDGQPVNPADWASDPWRPVLRDAPVELGGKTLELKAPFDPDSRLFARSAADDKAPIIALKAALNALDDAGLPLSVNLKVYLDGEEEAGSPGLRSMLEHYKDLLDSDLWLFCDGPMHQSRRRHLVYGVRGTVGLNMTIHGANRPLHSGHYGNWAPNPVMRLAELLTSMRDPRGKVLIEGFHDEVRPVSEQERSAVKASPLMDEQLLEELGLGESESPERLEMAILRPALNVRGIHSGGVGGDSRNAIQPTATASVGLRLVPDQTPEHLRRVVERHIMAQGYHIVRDQPSPSELKAHDRIVQINWSASGGYPAYRASFDDPMAKRIIEILDPMEEQGLILTPTMGGSLPIFVIEEVLNTPILILPIANHDNNQHGANENLRLQNLWDGIETYAALLTRF